MDTPEYDEMLRHLVRIAVHQDTINDRVTVAIERIDATLARQESTQARVETTLARIETLLARMLRPETNGREP